MSSNLLLRATGLSKVYSGSTHPLATLCHALFGIAADAADEYPVLDNITLDIRRGETVGIMGRNGAGKTTLLGILGDVIQPTKGTVERFGRIATLLGLTAGFNPNFTGRENAYLFCSIQGLSRRQTDDRIANIETFADLGRYFELPLRTYSSGMQSRLAFACAVHVSADLIIIDETLAVGDANFRMKCYDRIRQMKQEGQSFLLVSHNQNLLANFCTRGIVLEGGKKVFDGITSEAVEVYKRIRTEAMGDTDLKGKVLKLVSDKSALDHDVVLEGFCLTERDVDGESFGVVQAQLAVRRGMEHISMNFGISNHHGIVVCAWDGARAGMIVRQLKAGDRHNVEMMFRKRLLPGRYFVSCIIHELVGDVTKPQSIYQNFLSFEISGSDVMSGIADLEMSIAMLE
ncbi:MAG: ABC transporter ATP-binding protein [Nitrospira sp.]|nr:ABC transporter ATP-binding protein [Nitrospira sp.]MDH4368981.1 ABC transporter ATP-binding protein [Nitrospira sp.]MDH5347125.1 ABC transporter ATP-binding protein [Nitrospira sp.]MDH5496542.1 ABC transporter ATP-binding protein [Nitrospira sp.]MDH5726783.1 ABC transporter ATP-binding protein [Nitrospira sp.]